MSFEKANTYKTKIQQLTELNVLIKEIEEIYNTLDKETKNILKFNYIGREIVEYDDKNKNGNFWYNDAMFFRKKYFLFGRYIAIFKWACSFSPTLYQYKTDITKLNLKSLYNLSQYLNKYKTDLQKLKDNK
jgi:hypothetical protein